MDYMSEVKKLGFRRYQAERGDTFSDGITTVSYRISYDGGVGIVERKTGKSFPKKRLLETTFGLSNISEGLNWSLDMMKKYRVR